MDRVGKIRLAESEWAEIPNGAACFAQAFADEAACGLDMGRGVAGIFRDLVADALEL